MLSGLNLVAMMYEAVCVIIAVILGLIGVLSLASLLVFEFEIWYMLFNNAGIEGE